MRKNSELDRIASALSRVAVSEIVDGLRDRGLHRTNVLVSRCVYSIEHIEDDNTAIDHIINMIVGLVNILEYYKEILPKNTRNNSRSEE